MRTKDQNYAVSTAEETAGRVLVVDDHEQAREGVRFILREAGYQVESLASAVEALALLERESFDVIITDLNMPGMTGIEFMRHLQRRPHGAQVIMATAYATVATAVEAMRHGAFDYIEKPYTAEQLEELVARAVRRGSALDAKPGFGFQASQMLIGQSQPMQALRARLAMVAPTAETVLIAGESGTGKELVARAIHAASPRAKVPLVSLNCPVLSAQLMESELFGHERGAFTGADAPRVGRFELADGGSILLDEITEIDLPLQAKLLRVLQERSFERVGSSRPISVNVRVLATTNRDLKKEVAAGRFRDDLFYRLNVLPIALPPLRVRCDDIPLLATHFLRQAGERLQRDPLSLTASAIDLLCHYEWPGNVRELENVMTRASVLTTGGALAADALRPWLAENGDGATATHRREEGDTAGDRDIAAGLNLQEMEQRLIEATLDRFGGHRAKTAQALGIGLRTLSGKLKAYGYAPRAKPLPRAS